MVGFKSYLWRNLYFQGNSGISFLTNKSDFEGGKTFALTFGQQIGYAFPVGRSKNSYLDASARFESNTKLYTGAKANNYFGLRLAYTFNL